MTREEAIERIKMILEEATADEYAVSYVTSYDADALNMAIQALAQESCEDVISRKEVFDILIRNYRGYSMGVDGYCVPNYRKDIYDEIKALSSVTPQKPKTGHWINIDATHSKCDRCGVVFEIVSESGEANYCPNCGLKMVESEEK